MMMIIAVCFVLLLILTAVTGHHRVAIDRANQYYDSLVNKLVDSDSKGSNQE
jgi:uncharacterized protein YxeA